MILDFLLGEFFLTIWLLALALDFILNVVFFEKQISKTPFIILSIFKTLIFIVQVLGAIQMADFGRWPVGYFSALCLLVYSLLNLPARKFSGRVFCVLKLIFLFIGTSVLFAATINWMGLSFYTSKLLLYIAVGIVFYLCFLLLTVFIPKRVFYALFLALSYIQLGVYGLWFIL